MYSTRESACIGEVRVGKRLPCSGYSINSEGEAVEGKEVRQRGLEIAACNRAGVSYLQQALRCATTNTGAMLHIHEQRMQYAHGGTDAGVCIHVLV